MSIIVPGIVLAAGRSRRMGRAKALLPIGSSGETFIGRIVRVLRDSGVDDVLIVVADGRPLVTQALTDAEPPPAASSTTRRTWASSPRCRLDCGRSTTPESVACS